jgi:YgiT-type zinc finger domain-containing protein
MIDIPSPICYNTITLCLATIPFVLENTVAVIKDVPAEVCASCHESYMTGEVTDRVTVLLKQLYSLQTEVSVISYSALPRAA